MSELSSCRVVELQSACAARTLTEQSLDNSTTRQLDNWRIAVVFAFALLLPQYAHACPVCFGAPSAPLSKAANSGIFFLLGVIGFVQIGFVAMFWTFWRRAKALRAKREQFRVINGGLFG